MGRLAARLAPPTASDGSSRSSRLGKTGRTRQQLRRLWPAAYSTPPAAAPPTVSDGLPRGHAVIRCRLRCDRPLGYTLVNVDYYNVMFVQTKCGPCPALGTQTRHNQPAADRLHQARVPIVLSAAPGDAQVHSPVRRHPDRRRRRLARRVRDCTNLQAPTCSRSLRAAASSSPARGVCGCGGEGRFVWTPQMCSVQLHFLLK